MKMKAYSVEIMQTIKSYLEDVNMHRVAFDEIGEFSFPMYVGNSITFVNILIKVYENDYTVAAMCPVRPMTDDRKAALAEFFCYVNYRLRNGCFEMDIEDGEIYYKAFVDCEDQLPSQAVVCNSIACPAAMMKQYAPGILDVLFKNEAPIIAAEKCEKKCMELLRRELGETDEELDDILKMLHEIERGTDILKSKVESVDTEDSEQSEDMVPTLEDFLSMLDDAEEESEEFADNMDAAE